jgi:hypothetical protein
MTYTNIPLCGMSFSHMVVFVAVQRHRFSSLEIAIPPCGKARVLATIRQARENARRKPLAWP